MTDNGQLELPGMPAAPVQPEPLLAGHLVIYEDAIAFRPDGGADDQVVVRPLIHMARENLLELLRPGERGLLAAVLQGRMPKVPVGLLRDLKKARGE